MLIKNGTLCDKRGERKADIRVEEGKIKKIASKLEAKKNETVIDALGMYVMPGIVDIGASIGEGVQDIFGALKKVSNFAIKSGITTIAVQPDTAINTEVGLDYFFSKSREISLCSLTPIASATENNGCEKLTNMAIIYKNGAVGAYISSHANSNLIKRSMEYAKMYDKPLFVSCSNPHLDKGALMHEGAISFSMGLGGFSVVSESSEMARVVDIASYIGSKLVVRSLSSEKSVTIAKEAKSRYQTIFFDVSLHHLALIDESCIGYNSYAKNFPPLRERRDRDSLIEGLKSGVIDVLSSGHKPATRVMKDLSFEDASFGIESLEFFASAAYAICVDNDISISKMSELTSYNPSKIIGLETKGLLKEGYDADMLLFDPVAKPNSPHARSPYLDVKLSGGVKYTIIDGEIRFAAN